MALPWKHFQRLIIPLELSYLILQDSAQVASCRRYCLQGQPAIRAYLEPSVSPVEPCVYLDLDL